MLYKTPKITLIFLICVLLSACPSNRKTYPITTPTNQNFIYSVVNSISLFNEACLEEFIDTGRIDSSIKKYGFKPLLDENANEYTGKEFLFTYTSGGYVITYNGNKCTVFDKYYENLKKHREFISNNLRPKIHDIKKIQHKSIFNFKNDITETSISYKEMNLERKISFYSTKQISSDLLVKFTNRKDQIHSNNQFTLHQKQPDIVKSILSLDLTPKSVATTKIKQSLECTILIKLFGNCLTNRKTAFWTLPDDFYTSEVNINKRKQQYWDDSKSKVASKIIKFINIGKNQTLAIFQTKPVGNMYSCSGCSPLIGAITLKKMNGKWNVMNKNKFIKFSGRRGEVKKEAIELINDSGIFSISNHSIGQGHHTFSISIIYPEEKSFKLAWHGIVGRSNEGDCEAPEYDVYTKCRSFKYSTYFSNQITNGLPDMIMNAAITGTPKSDDYKGEKLLYKFNGTEYQLLK